MFWKKKDKSQSGPPRIKVPADNRQAYRINPAQDEPIILEIADQTTEVVDISSGGLCFGNLGLQKGEQYDVRFIIPYTLDEIEARLEILRIGNGNLCHGRFMNLPVDFENKIHKYVLDRQKEDLQF